MVLRPSVGRIILIAIFQGVYNSSENENERLESCSAVMREVS